MFLFIFSVTGTGLVQGSSHPVFPPLTDGYIRLPDQLIFGEHMEMAAIVFDAIEGVEVTGLLLTGEKFVLDDVYPILVQEDVDFILVQEDVDPILGPIPISIFEEHHLTINPLD